MLDVEKCVPRLLCACVWLWEGSDTEGMCLGRKNMGNMSPLGIGHRWPHPTGELVLGLESSRP